jgi:hypothetical protein
MPHLKMTNMMNYLRIIMVIFQFAMLNDQKVVYHSFFWDGFRLHQLFGQSSGDGFHRLSSHCNTDPFVSDLKPSPHHSRTRTFDGEDLPGSTVVVGEILPGCQNSGEVPESGPTTLGAPNRGTCPTGL